MARVTRGKIYELAKELENMGVAVLVSKINSQYYVTLCTKSNSVTFSGIALQVERLIRAFKLGYEWGWTSRGNADAG